MPAYAIRVPYDPNLTGEDAGSTADDDALGSVPFHSEDLRFRHFVDPQDWDGSLPLWLLEKGSYYEVAGSLIDKMPTKVSSSSLFNGRPAFDFASVSTGGDVKIVGSRQSPSRSYTWACVCMFNPVGKVGVLIGFSRIAGMHPGVLVFNKAGDLRFTNTGHGLHSHHTIKRSNLPDDAVAHFVLVSYHEPTKTSTIFIDNGADALSTYVHANGAPKVTGAEICIGGLGRSTLSGSGYDHLIGKTFIWEAALHVTSAGRRAIKALGSEIMKQLGR